MRQVHEHLAVLLLREHIDDAIERFRGVIGMQRAEDEVSGTGHVQRRLHRFAIAYFTDLDDIRRGPHGALQRAPIGLGVEADLALIDDRLLVRVQELDRVLHRNNM